MQHCTMTSRVLVLGLILCMVRTLNAQDTTHAACWDTAMSQADLTQRAGTDLQTSRARLQHLLVELGTTLDSAARPGLRIIQARWGAYAKIQCTWEGAAYDGGRMLPMIWASCLADRTEERI